MISSAMGNYFTASAGAGATLVGLVFVAISLWPREKMVAAQPTWRAVAGGAFFALMNAFLVSLSALNRILNLGWPVFLLSLIGTMSTLWLGLPLLRLIPDWKKQISLIIANGLMIFVSFAVYAAEGYCGVRLLLSPDDVLAVEGIAIVLILLYALGLIHSWELLGVEQIGLRKWLNPLQQHIRSEDKRAGRDEENTGEHE